MQLSKSPHPSSWGDFPNRAVNCFLSSLPSNTESDGSDQYSETGHASEAKGYQSVICQEASTEGRRVPLPESPGASRGPPRGKGRIRTNAEQREVG